MDPNFSMIVLVGIAMSSIAMFLGVFFILRNKFKNDGYIFLYLILIVISYETFYKTLLHSKFIYDMPILYIPGRFYNLLIYPLCLLFIWSVTKKNFKLRLDHWILLGVFILYTIIRNRKIFKFNIEEKKAILDLFYQPRRIRPYDYWSTWETFIQSALIPILFILIIGYNFFRFKKRYVNTETKRLYHILTIIIFLYFFFNHFSNFLYQWLYDIINYDKIIWPIDIVFLSIISLLFVVIALLVNSGSSFFPKVKYNSSALDTKEYKGIIGRAEALLEKEKLYTKEGFSLYELSQLIDSNSKYLSQAINHHLEISFIDFINNYRVQEAKKQLSDPRNSNITLAAIGAMCGFKSKSTFIRAFKKATNKTPSQYIKSQ